jgi:NAD(P)-dependent dehydrogenase (short-subunit alcohol dehydrogenase family)
LFDAFAQHERTYGKLDVLVNNAGIGESRRFLKDESTDGKGSWRKTIDVNLTAVIDATRLGVSQNVVKSTVVSLQLKGHSLTFIHLLKSNKFPQSIQDTFLLRQAVT